MEKVVVVVVVTIREGSLGSGIRFDCENLSDPRLLIASSEAKECSILVNLTRCGARGKLTTNVENKSLKSWFMLACSDFPTFYMPYPCERSIIVGHAQ